MNESIRVGAVYRNGNAFYRMKDRPKRYNDGYVWALWQPVRPVLGGLFYTPIFSREPFLLDMEGFRLVGGAS